ncbi:hypothetical protein AAY473_000708 [Plecturocebus cupreus]
MEPLHSSLYNRQSMTLSLKKKVEIMERPLTSERGTRSRQGIICFLEPSPTTCQSYLCQE